MPGIARSLRIRIGKALANQGFATGEAQFRYAVRGRDVGYALNFFKAENLFACLKLHAFFRHAIEAADVAAVGDADAQAIVQASESVAEFRHKASIRSIGRSARCMSSAGSSTLGCKRHQAIAQFFKRIQPHVGALAAVAVFIRDEVEALAGRELLHGKFDATFRHDYEFARGVADTVIDEGGGGSDKFGVLQERVRGIRDAQ